MTLQRHLFLLWLLGGCGEPLDLATFEAAFREDVCAVRAECGMSTSDALCQEAAFVPTPGDCERLIPAAFEDCLLSLDEARFGGTCDLEHGLSHDASATCPRILRENELCKAAAHRRAKRERQKALENGDTEIGRPARDASGTLALPPASGSDDPIASTWLRQARLEAASVSAFTQLARDLEALGAPESLVQDHLAAAADESRHAARCLAVARSRDPRVQLGPPPPSAPLTTLQAFVDATVRDGVLGETWAALDALACARDACPEVRSVLAEIAHDEQVHARLAWRSLIWALSVDPTLADRVRAKLDRIGPPLEGSIHAPTWGLRTDLRHHRTRVLHEVIRPAWRRLQGVAA